MATVRPFRALRYNTHDPLSVALVTAPPYDCISPAQRDDLYRLHPHNIVRLILGKDMPGDDEQHNKYARAADLLAKWQATSILRRDPEPALYLYQQEFVVEGRSYLREGVLARVGLEEFGAGRVFPHEETMPGPRADRLRLMQAVRANLSPVFSVYPDPRNTVVWCFRDITACEPIVQTVDGDGVLHRLFASSNPDLIAAVADALADKPFYIADGHHRYETALLYKRQLQEAGQTVGPEHPAASILMLCVSMHHPGLAILPTHRVLHGLQGLTTQRLRAATQEHFRWQEFVGAEATSPQLLRHLAEAPAHTFGLWTRDTAQAFLLTLKASKAMDGLAPEHSKAWRRLDVAILQRLLFGEDLPRASDSASQMTLSYVHLAQQAFDAVHEDGADAAVLLKPLPVRSLQDVAKVGERMPAKSTYFYPKALSGLVINLLD